MKARFIILLSLISTGLFACSAVENTHQVPPVSQIVTNTSLPPQKTLLAPQAVKATPTPSQTNLPTVTRIVSPTSSPTNIPTATPTVKPTMIPTATRVVSKSLPQEFASYLGFIFPPLPEGIMSGFGMTISGDGSQDFGIEIVHIEDMYQLWFSKFYKRIDNKAYWEVIDILALPEPTNNDSEVFVPGGCLFQKDYDPEIVAIAKHDQESQETRFLTNEKILKAWRLNRFYEIIEPIPTDGIECHEDNALNW